MTVTRFPGTMTAKELLDALAADPNIMEVIAVVRSMDDAVQVVYTASTPQDIAMASVILADSAMKAAFDRDENRLTAVKPPHRREKVEHSADCPMGDSDHQPMALSKCNTCNRLAYTDDILMSACPLEPHECPVKRGELTRTTDVKVTIASNVVPLPGLHCSICHAGRGTPAAANCTATICPLKTQDPS